MLVRLIYLTYHIHVHNRWLFRIFKAHFLHIVYHTRTRTLETFFGRLDDKVLGSTGRSPAEWVLLGDSLPAGRNVTLPWMCTDLLEVKTTDFFNDGNKAIERSASEVTLILFLGNFNLLVTRNYLIDWCMHATILFLSMIYIIGRYLDQRAWGSSFSRNNS